MPSFLSSRARPPVDAGAWPSSPSPHDEALAKALGGAILGFCCGYSVKQAGRSLALAVGLGVVCVAITSHEGGERHPLLNAASRALRRVADELGLELGALRLLTPAQVAARLRVAAAREKAAALAFVPATFFGLWCG